MRIEQFFRDLEKRGEYFGNGSPADKELVQRLYGIVNVGPPLKLRRTLTGEAALIRNTYEPVRKSASTNPESSCCSASSF